MNGVYIGTEDLILLSVKGRAIATLTFGDEERESDVAHVAANSFAAFIPMPATSFPVGPLDMGIACPAECPSVSSIEMDGDNM